MLHPKVFLGRSGDRVAVTVGSSKAVAEVNASGFRVETERTLTRDSGAQVVAPRMLDLAPG